MSNRQLSMAQTSSGTSTFASEVLRLVNRERAKAGLPAYTTTKPLSSAANQRAKEITSKFSHTRPDGSNFFTVLRENKIPFMAAGENIAYGQSTPQQVITNWMGSTGHRKNILSSRFKKVGIGVTQKNGRNYWTELFTN